MLVDRLSIEALKTILGRTTDDLPRVDLARVTTASLPALRSYLEGEILYRKADWPTAIEAYRRAVDADSTFALAWLRLAESISWLPPGTSPKAVFGRPPSRGPVRSSLAGTRGRARPRLPGVLRGLDDNARSLKSAATRRYPDDPELSYLLRALRALGDQLSSIPLRPPSSSIDDHSIPPALTTRHPSSSRSIAERARARSISVVIRASSRRDP